MFLTKSDPLEVSLENAITRGIVTEETLSGLLIDLYDSEKNSALSMDFSPLLTVLEGDFDKDNASSATEIDTLENLDDTKQISKGKPPRHLTSTTTRLQVAANAVIYMAYDFCFYFFTFLFVAMGFE